MLRVSLSRKWSQDSNPGPWVCSEPHHCADALKSKVGGVLTPFCSCSCLHAYTDSRKCLCQMVPESKSLFGYIDSKGRKAWRVDPDMQSRSQAVLALLLVGGPQTLPDHPELQSPSHLTPNLGLNYHAGQGSRLPSHSGIL